MVKNPPANAGDIRHSSSRSLGQEGPPKEGMATHSSILAWKIPWTEEAGRLQSMGLPRDRRGQHGGEGGPPGRRCAPLGLDT